jgi:hypothetical protein
MQEGENLGVELPVCHQVFTVTTTWRERTKTRQPIRYKLLGHMTRTAISDQGEAGF